MKTRKAPVIELCTLRPGRPLDDPYTPVERPEWPPWRYTLARWLEVGAVAIVAGAGIWLACWNKAMEVAGG